MIKRLLIHLLGYCFRISVLIFAIACTLVLVFGSPQYIKQALKESQIYSTFVDAFAQQAQKTTAQSSNQGGQAVNQLDITNAAKEALTPATIQSSVEQFVDGTYHWLEGKTPAPDFRIDLQPATQIFVTKLTDESMRRIKSRPVCTRTQLLQLDPRTINVSNLECLPPGIDLTAAQEQTTAKIVADNEFLRNPVLTASNFSKDAQGQTPFQKIPDAPKIYHWLILSPWIFGLLAVFFGTGIFLGRRDWRRALRGIAASVIGAGVLLLIIGGSGMYISANAVKPQGVLGKLTTNPFQHVIIQFFSSLSHIITHRLFIFGGTYTLLGIVVLLVIRRAKPPDPINYPIPPPPGLDTTLFANVPKSSPNRNLPPS